MRNCCFKRVGGSRKVPLALVLDLTCSRERVNARHRQRSYHGLPTVRPLDVTRVD